MKGRVDKPCDQWDHTNAMGHGLLGIIEGLIVLLFIMPLTYDYVGWWTLGWLVGYPVFWSLRIWWDSTEWSKEDE